MAIFRYRAVDADGKQEKGILEADSPRHLRALLKERGLTVLEVGDVTTKGGGWRHGALDRSSRLSAGDLALITRQYAALLAAGISVEKALDALIDQSTVAAASNILANVRAEVRAGHSLADAMSRQPKAFPDIYRALVRGGESAGSLPRVMVELADFLEAREEVRQKMALALLYPLTVSLVAALVVGGLMIYVVPQIAGVFTQTKQTLPWLTRALLGLTDFLRIFGPWCLLLLFGMALAFANAYRQSPGFRQRIQSRLIQLPLIGRLIRISGGARFASTMAILLSGGVPMLSALSISAESAGFDIFREAANRASERVREGAPLARALKAETVFPPLLLHFIVSGESGGELSSLLQHAARQLQGELENRMRWLGGLFEPLLIVGMGGVVLLIVLAVLMPIIEMNHLLR